MSAEELAALAAELALTAEEEAELRRAREKTLVELTLTDERNRVKRRRAGTEWG